MQRLLVQGVTWNWSNPGWANIIQNVRPVEGCATPGNAYDGASPDNFVIQAHGSGSTPAEPNGGVVVTLNFGVTGVQGRFLFDTACATPVLHTIFMVEPTGADHGCAPGGTCDVTFKPGIVTIGPCECSYHCDLNLDGAINPSDVVCIVNYVYKGIDCRLRTCCPGETGDWDCGGAVSPVDVVHCVNYVCKGMTDKPPCDPCARTPYPNCPPWPQGAGVAPRFRRGVFADAGWKACATHEPRTRWIVDPGFPVLAGRSAG